MAAGADALDQRALRNELDIQLAGQHLLLGFGVEADMADDGLAHQLGADQLADAASGHRGIVGDDRKVAFVLPYDLVDHALGRADRHEATDHQACAVGDHGNRLVARETVCYRPSVTSLLRGPAAIDRQCRAANLGGGIGAQKDRQCADCSGVANSCDGCFSDSKSDFA